MVSPIKVAVLGGGTMGSGIAQLAASAGHEVLVYDSSREIRSRIRGQIGERLDRLAAKGKLTSAERDAVLARLTIADAVEAFASCGLAIEAIVEDLAAKQQVCRDLERVLSSDAVMATNTSSLSVSAVGGLLERPRRFLGMHFFNPAAVMPLVELVRGLNTDQAVIEQMFSLTANWGKSPVVVSDIPGFLVNRIARPYYGEALHIAEEGIAEPATIDWAMREQGGFRMGPFELMDFIGIDVNFAVSSNIFQAYFCDPRYRPSLLQRQYVDSGRLGRKTGLGFYDYRAGAAAPKPVTDPALGAEICERILALLFNEAIDALGKRIASRDDIETAMLKGVNYPRGLLSWAEEFGLKRLLDRLDCLQRDYGDDRYRPCPLLRKTVNSGRTSLPGT